MTAQWLKTILAILKVYSIYHLWMLIVGTAPCRHRAVYPWNGHIPTLLIPAHTPSHSLSNDIRLCWHQELVVFSLGEDMEAFVTYASEKVRNYMPLGADHIISGLRINHTQQYYTIPTVQPINKYVKHLLALTLANRIFNWTSYKSYLNYALFWINHCQHH